MKTILVILTIFFSFPLVEKKLILSQHARVTKVELVRLLKQSGFPHQSIPMMSCIAEKESNLQITIINVNRNNTKDYGLMQINSVWLDGCNVTEKDLMNPIINLKCAHIIYLKQGVGAWYTKKLCERNFLTSVSK